MSKKNYTPECKDMAAKHPCFAEDASHNYARMHLPVAPACNIQCNYCNRKYDCVNESRPGVTSRVSTPREALLKVMEIRKRLPCLTVAGIAGPGDPLADSEKTFETFRLIKKTFPDIFLCLSTNGLMLQEHIDKMRDLSITHVTVTINAVDTDVGSKIYKFIKLNGNIYKGKKASSILIQRQLAAVHLLKEAKILCKVNSVLIPGINDRHLHKVSQAIKELGAFVHNIVPYIPVKGSSFQNRGIKKPSPADIKKLQEKCGCDMKMMYHCKQCRADAVGMLEKGDTELGRYRDSVEDKVPVPLYLENMEAREFNFIKGRKKEYETNSYLWQGRYR